MPFEGSQVSQFANRLWVEAVASVLQLLRMINWCRASLLHQPFTMILAICSQGNLLMRVFCYIPQFFCKLQAFAFLEILLCPCTRRKGRKGRKGPKAKVYSLQHSAALFYFNIEVYQGSPSLEVKSKCAAMFLVAMENCQMFFDSGTANTWETLPQDYFWSAMTRPRSAPA